MVPATGKIVYLPQNFLLAKEQTTCLCLGISAKFEALRRIYKGSEALTDYDILDDAWNIAERTQNRLESYRHHSRTGD
ncbi:MAG: hypothetical protein COZ46_03535 [Verrucomicrobia bacterium CG_4_10_14_3_um_filter_43_23]|nr:MAG: hypothetical protein AUJ82_02680 [Verrucomicrobia bacterium CG1_02_43_26]PIP59166.1 MAG: hypothetical protein COX01_05085 [Verrucomicrobia bacterium CG22_combo_CG10-13_8_21_14_all_43_17]PIX58442.1 MAG: hypothetical protein COZ46_03535 [Verrucomicrobia bacterium CG_4_10_14_3_um_filter_43_23]PIY60828.1 MAG: hypothetical protein COY94_08550 [Verrucomicrobia bacterium CG_4_10_14_0_8_um_filter_43_34]PJA44884.1 MAG: hypothetical protein CO175_00480 [Verrucomicrobia bacterium CG_4_9_14_3_um_fi